jgi:O-antigen/teichoic acid export membrane protein
VQDSNISPSRLAGQTAINFSANVFSAAFGLINVVVFTRLFAPGEYGTYVLGMGFAVTVSTFLSSWLRLHIIRQQSRGDGTDVRGIVLPGFLLSCLTAPLAYAAARLIGLQDYAAAGAVGLAVAIGFFETSQELLRARLAAFTMMKATMLRAVLVPLLGISFTLVDTTGVLLLMSSALAYLLAAIAFTGSTWWGTTIKFDGAQLLNLAKAGLPLTLSLTLLAISSVIDRFIVAYLAGAASAGQYSVGVDLVRQTLIIPSISAAAAFIPLAVQILANKGPDAAKAHLDKYFEQLLAITLPACLGFAIVSYHIANVILGPEFRATASQTMPIVSVAVVFQILTQQYLHISFLLSNRNAFYLVNTGSVIIFNAVVCFLLISRFGVIGAAWARLSAEMFGFASALILTRWAFPVPLPFGRTARVFLVAATMAVVVGAVDAKVVTADKTALVILVAAGIASYLALCWLMDIARARTHTAQCLLAVRSTITQFRGR